MMKRNIKELPTVQNKRSFKTFPMSKLSWSLWLFRTIPNYFTRNTYRKG